MASNWLRRLRGAVGMGITWAIGWAAAGLLIGVASNLLPFLPWDLFFRVFDAPLPALAVPGFIGGVIFSLVLGVAGRHRRFDQLSLRRFAVWGAIGGLLLSLVPAALVFAGVATIADSGAGQWAFSAAIAAPLVVLSTVSATGSLLLARKASRETPALNSGFDEPQLTAHDI